jgi:integrase
MSSSARDKLNTVKITTCSKPGYLSDGGGLYLQVTRRAALKPGEKPRKPQEDVTKSWCFRYRDRVSGALRELGLGPWVDVSLKEARDKAADLRAMLRDGKDPKTARQAQRAEAVAERANQITFAEATAKYWDTHKSGWKSVTHAENWLNKMKTHAHPSIGAMQVGTIKLANILQVLEPIWTTKAETASRVRGQMEAILDWCKGRGYLKGENPATWKGNLDAQLPPSSRVKNQQHHAALAYGEINEFVAKLREHKGVAALALEFLILTASRTGEVIGATWDEFEIDKGLWNIPKERMKAGKEHTVVLAPRAVEIIKEMEKAKLGAFVFPGGKPGMAQSNAALAAVLKRMERLDVTVHGFRSTFRDWAGETVRNVDHRTIENALAHQLKDKAEAAYSRGSMIEKRRVLMNAWADFCDTPKAPAGVVPLRTAL